MTNLRQAAEMALKALEVATTHLPKDRQEVLEAMRAVRQALAETDTGTYRGAWSDVPDATKWVDDLRGGDANKTTRYSQIISGAIYDFAGFLATRDKTIEVGAKANPVPVANLLKEWAKMRRLSLEDVAVSCWQDVLEESSNSATDVVEPIEVAVIGNWGKVEWREGVFPQIGDKMYSAPPKREWAGLTKEEFYEIVNKKWWDWKDTFDIEGFSRAVEVKLKEKNHGNG